MDSKTTQSIDAKLKKLQNQLDKIDKEIATAPGLRRASLYIRKQEVLRKTAKLIDKECLKKNS